MMSERREPQPLAFRAKPEPDEYFGSWLDRLAACHDATRAQLFSYLEIDPALAGQDLACGRNSKGVSSEAADQVIERLAWAVQCEVDTIARAFVATGPDWLLPLKARYYGCARCWLEWIEAGRPPIILREWILSLSWHCQRHESMLVDLRPYHRTEPTGARRQWLGRMAHGSAEAFGQLGFDEERLSLNRQAAGKLTSQQPFMMPKMVREYATAFGKNQLHFSSARCLLLGLMHGHDRRAPRKFARLFPLLSCPALPPALPSEGEPVTLAVLAQAIRRVHRRTHRDRYRQLEKLRSRLAEFRYLGRQDAGAGDWQRSAMHALRSEHRQRRSSRAALDALKLARTYAMAVDRQISFKWGHEPFDPARWGFVMPSVAQLDEAIHKSEMEAASADRG